MEPTSSEDDIRGSDDGAERIGQVMREHADKQLAELLRFLEDVDLGPGVSELDRALVPLGPGIVAFPPCFVALMRCAALIISRKRAAVAGIHTPVLAPIRAEASAARAVVRPHCRLLSRVPCGLRRNAT